jgi:hypothetical protein
MLDKDLKNALHGMTVIEEDIGAVSRILARQLGGYAKAAGRRVVVLSLTVQDPQNAAAEAQRMQDGMTTRDTGSRGVSPGAQVFGGGIMTVLLGGGTGYDLMVVEGFSSFLFDKTDREVAESIRQMTRLADQGKSFIVTFDSDLVGEKTAAYIRAAADTVILVKTEVVGTRIDRMLYVRKMKDSLPSDRLIKITVDQAGVQVDTREFVG